MKSRFVLCMAALAAAAHGCGKDSASKAGSPPPVASAAPAGKSDRANPDAYLERVLKNTKYNLQAAMLHNQNVHIPKHDPQKMAAVFEEHKEAIIRPLVPCLRTYDDREYPGIYLEAYGWPCPPDGREIVFHVDVEATISPRGPGHGTRPLLDDGYLAAVCWNPAERKATSFVFNSAGGSAIPADVLVKARAIAAGHDARYQRDNDWPWPLWLPAWYVKQEVFSEKPASGNTSSYWSFIRENTGHNLVALTFGAAVDEQRKTGVYHHVVIDVPAGKVVGVHSWEKHLGPDYYDRPRR